MSDSLTQETRVLAVDLDAIWVEGVMETTCSSCKAKSGCGQHWLSKFTGQSYLRLELDDASHYQVGDRVSLSINANALVCASVIAYGLPLLMMIGSLLIAKPYLPSEVLAVAVAAVGFLLGAFLVRRISRGAYLLRYFQPKVTRLIQLQSV